MREKVSDIPETREVISSRQDIMVWISFPALFLLLSVLLLIACCIRYPETVKGRVVVKNIDTSKRSVAAVLEFPRNYQVNLSPGMHVRLFFNHPASAKTDCIDGFLKTASPGVTASTIGTIITIKGFDRGKIIFPVADGTGDIVIFTRDMNLLQRLFSNYGNRMMK